MANIWQEMIQEKISRRGFMRGLGIVGAGVAVQSAIPAGVLQAAAPFLGGESIPALQEMENLPFAPIQPGAVDDVVVPEGFNVQLLIKRGDVFTADGKTFGDNADWTGWYPLEGMENEGLLIVNNEYINTLLVGGYVEGEKSLEQINLEKAH